MVRTSNCTPMASSSACTCLLTVERGTSSARAAAAKPLLRTVSIKARMHSTLSISVSIQESMKFNIS
ncbi:hypothetical protein FQZ97_1264770 [compost metagenome]